MRHSKVFRNSSAFSDLISNKQTGSKMQSRYEGTIKRYGHHRRPSYGKAMPVSALLLNFSVAPNSSHFDSISRDGASPDHERPPMIFNLDDENYRDDEPEKNEELNKFMETERMDVELNELLKFSEHEPKKSDELRKFMQEEFDDDSSSTSSVTADDEFVFISAKNGCTNKDVTVDIEDLHKNDAISQLCNLLCDNSCKKNAKKQPITETYAELNDKSIDNDRQSFLSSMIQDEYNPYADGLDVPYSAKIPNTPVAEEQNSKDAEMFAAKNLNIKDLSEKLAIAEALARTSMMTSPAAKRRLAARKIEMELDADSVGTQFEDDYDYVPPKQLLMYLVRMGSFNSAPKINNADTQDDSLDIPNGLSTSDLVHHCMLMRGENRPQLLTRNFLKPIKNLVTNDLTDGLRVLQLDSVSKVCSEPKSSPNHLRLFQWNMLSQSLGQNNDGFVCCPDEALTWECRKYLIIQEIIQNDPDIICLQEVDHFKFLQSVLGTQDYEGIFFPKPDSPCLYISENNGPDGCAIFYKRNKFELVNYDTRILEVWRVQSNQVAIAANFRVLQSGKEFCVCTTHLKARNGALLSKLRNEQGKDLLRFAHQSASAKPLLICGDFNAEPSEPVYSTIVNNKMVTLSSAYADMIANVTKRPADEVSDTIPEQDESINKQRSDILAKCEPPFTTWKIREDGEVCHTIDYVFYCQDNFKVKNCLMFPHGNEIGKERTPSFRYPSDHFSLVCDFEFKDDDATTDADPMTNSSSQPSPVPSLPPPPTNSSSSADGHS